MSVAPAYAAAGTVTQGVNELSVRYSYALPGATELKLTTFDAIS
jgi:hypothetical protein